MLRILKKWIDGGRDYWKAVYIYSSFPDVNQDLLASFKSGRTDDNAIAIANLLEAEHARLQSDSLFDKKPAEVPTPGAVVDVLSAAKYEAEVAYKELMNTRSVLFRLANKEISTADDMEQRRLLALEVVKSSKVVSALYDKVDYIATHGKLPAAPEPEKKDIPDFMVYSILDNLRKNVAKLKARPKTPERLQAIAEQILKVEELEMRWKTLKDSYHG